MKGVTSASFANATSKRFQSDHIITSRVDLPDGIELFDSLKKLLAGDKKHMASIAELVLKVKELEDKVKDLETKLNSFEVEQ